MNIAALPDSPIRLVEILREHGIELIEAIIALSDDELSKLEGITAQDIQTIRAILQENVDIIEEEDEAEQIDYQESESDVQEEEDEDYYCPECGKEITIDMTTCPNCGVGLSFEIEGDEDTEEE